MSLCHCRRSRAGVTLIEVLVAAGLLVFTVIGLIGVFPLQARALALGRAQVAAAAIAERELEAAVGAGYAAAAARSGTDTITSTVNGVSVSTVLESRTSVTTLTSQLKDVVVQVTWNEGGMSRVVTLETLLAPSP